MADIVPNAGLLQRVAALTPYIAPSSYPSLMSNTNVNEAPVPPALEQLAIDRYNASLEERYTSSNTTNPGATTNNSSFFENILSNPSFLAPSDIGTSLARTGSAFAYNPSTSANPSRARTGQIFSIIGNAGSALLQGARATLAGYVTAKVNQEQQQAYRERLRESAIGAEEQLRDGGSVNSQTVEVEDGEIIRSPQGDVIEVDGRTHEQGGELFNLQIGTEVTTNNTKIGKSGVKTFTDAFPNLNLKLKTTDTYADVIRKASSKIGVEQKREELNKLRDNLDTLDTRDINTYNLNAAYLSNKLEEQQRLLEVLQASERSVVDTVFDVQESKKSNRTPVIDGFFKNGGLVSNANMDALVKKTGLPRNYIEGYLYRCGGKVRKMDDGGKIYYQQVLNQFALPEYGSQRLTSTGITPALSGRVTQDAFIDRVNETLRIFPQSANYFDIERDADGNVVNMKFKDNESAREYQKYVNEVYKNISDYADRYIDNAEQRASLKNYISGLRFDPESKESVRFTDNIFGDFTSSRSGVALPLVTNEELERLQAEGVTNFSQVFDENGNIRNLQLSESTQNALNDIRNRYGDNFEANLLGYEVPGDPVPPDTTDAKVVTGTEPPTVTENGVTVTNPDPRAGLDDTVGATTGVRSQFQIPFLPNQYRYDYDTTDAHLLQDPRFGRLTARRIDPASTIQPIYNALDEGIRSTAGYADPQRLSVTSNLVAGTQTAIGQAVVDLETQNMSNSQTVEQFNIGQQDREEVGRLSERRTYEELQLRALENTRNNNEIINNHNRRVQLGNFDTVNRLKTINNFTPNYRIGADGQVYYDKTSATPFAVQLPLGSSQFDLDLYMKQREALESVMRRNEVSSSNNNNR